MFIIEMCLPCLSVHLSVRQSVRPSVCLSVCLSVIFNLISIWWLTSHTQTHTSGVSKSFQRVNHVLLPTLYDVMNYSDDVISIMIRYHISNVITAFNWKCTTVKPCSLMRGKSSTCACALPSQREMPPGYCCPGSMKPYVNSICVTNSDKQWQTSFVTNWGK